MSTRSLFQTGDMIEQHRLLNEVSRLVDAGVLRTTLQRHLGPLNAANLTASHRLLESGRAIGKIVLDGIESWCTESDGWFAVHRLDTALRPVLTGMG
jgi:hypothetical protein